MPDGITIEKLDPANIDEVGPLWKALLDHIAALPEALVPVRPSDQSWKLEREVMFEALKGDAFALAGRRGGEAVGYLFVRIEGPDPVWYTGDTHAELAHLCVAEGERGNGVGSALMDAMAVRLYKGRGYRPDFRIFYGSPGRKPWASLRREEEDRKAGRGRFAPPRPDAGTAGPAAPAGTARIEDKP